MKLFIAFVLSFAFATVTNPFEGAKGYILPEFVHNVRSSMAIADIPEAEVVTRQPIAIWADNTANIRRIRENLPLAYEQALKEPTFVQFVVYNLPGRDCSAFASNGEIPLYDMERYKRYIDEYKTELDKYSHQNLRVILYIEPDSLPNLVTNLNQERCRNASQGYRDGIAYAMATLYAPNRFMYMDLGHGGWLGYPSGLQATPVLYKSVIDAAKNLNPSLQVQGFAIGISNYNAFEANGQAPAKEFPLVPVDGELTYDWNACIDELTFARKIAVEFEKNGIAPRFVVDTSRNGQNGIRQRWSSWCNVKGAGFGLRPTVNPHRIVDALAWIKVPGESDGVAGPAGVPRLDINCDPTTAAGIDALPGAPQAGQWFHEQFVMLVKNANPPLQ
jgi:cellulose 1,4-beta-cellobiosidase